MNDCPCCSSSMLRHIEHNRVYWYCPSCHQEMPNFSLEMVNRQLNPSARQAFNLFKEPNQRLAKLALS